MRGGAPDHPQVPAAAAQKAAPPLWRCLGMIPVRTVVLLGLLAVTPAFADDRAPQSAGTHLVQTGDTAWNISRRYGITVDQLAAANGVCLLIQGDGQARTGSSRSTLPCPPSPPPPSRQEPLSRCRSFAARSACSRCRSSAARSARSRASLRIFRMTDRSAINRAKTPHPQPTPAATLMRRAAQTGDQQRRRGTPRTGKTRSTRLTPPSPPRCARRRSHRGRC